MLTSINISLRISKAIFVIRRENVTSKVKQRIVINCIDPGEETNHFFIEAEAKSRTLVKR